MVRKKKGEDDLAILLGRVTEREQAISNTSGAVPPPTQADYDATNPEHVRAYISELDQFIYDRGISLPTVEVQDTVVFDLGGAGEQGEGPDEIAQLAGEPAAQPPQLPPQATAADLEKRLIPALTAAAAPGGTHIGDTAVIGVVPVAQPGGQVQPLKRTLDQYLADITSRGNGLNLLQSIVRGLELLYKQGEPAGTIGGRPENAKNYDRRDTNDLKRVIATLVDDIKKHEVYLYHKVYPNQIRIGPREVRVINTTLYNALPLADRLRIDAEDFSRSDPRSWGRNLVAYVVGGFKRKPKATPEAPAAVAAAKPTTIPAKPAVWYRTMWYSAQPWKTAAARVKDGTLYVLSAVPATIHYITQHRAAAAVLGVVAAAGVGGYYVKACSGDERDKYDKQYRWAFVSCDDEKNTIARLQSDKARLTRENSDLIALVKEYDPKAAKYDAIAAHPATALTADQRKQVLQDIMDKALASGHEYPAERIMLDTYCDEAARKQKAAQAAGKKPGKHFTDLQLTGLLYNHGCAALEGKTVAANVVATLYASVVLPTVKSAATALTQQGGVLYKATVRKSRLDTLTEGVARKLAQAVRANIDTSVATDRVAFGHHGALIDYTIHCNRYSNGN